MLHSSTPSLVLICWFPACRCRESATSCGGVAEQSEGASVTSIQPQSGRGENVRKQAVELPRGDEDKGNEELASALGATSFILGESLPVLPAKLVRGS